jgi:hypothetical protein
MSPAYALNAPPDTRCDCGPALICTHRAPAPTNPAGTIPAVPANPAGNHKKS